MSNKEEPDYEGLYVLGCKSGKNKTQFLHKVKNGLIIRNGIQTNILIFKKDEVNSDKAIKTVRKIKAYDNFIEYPLKDIIEQNKPVTK